MESSSKMDLGGEDEALEEELVGFDDFTIASSWERFISDIEAACRLWLADGPKILLEKGAFQVGFSNNLYKVKSELKYAMKTYCMEYYFETENNGKVSDWNGTFHDVQMCFGVKDFLLIFPQSVSGVVLDAPESSKLLSAVAIALTNCSSLWPAFVPVHDPSREAYVGIQSLGTLLTRRFEADCINSEVPLKLMHLEGLYELFVSKFAYSTLDISTRSFPVSFTMKLTYIMVLYDDDDIRGPENKDKKGDIDGETIERIQWDDEFPWSEWYSAEDPVKGCDLIAIWFEKMVESSLEMAELENASPREADKWILLPNIDDSKGYRTGFASQLRLLVSALEMSSNAQVMEDFVSDAVEDYGPDYLSSSMVVPPPAVLDRVFKDIFHEGERFPDHFKGEHKSSRTIKGAPLGSLFTQFCLHCLWVGNCNIRAIAVLWIEFVREVRWCWEECQPLPRMSAHGSIDLSTCLINQKLHMLAICIEKKRELNEDYQDCIGSIDEPYDFAEGKDLVEENLADMHIHGISERTDRQLEMDGLSYPASNVSESFREAERQLSASSKSSDSIRKGSSGVVGSMMLLKSHQSMHAPYTQAPPPMTEDMHEERLHAIEAFGDSSNFSAQLEKDILLSDMSAFKAANPDAVFEDFIRWHSPGDWENDNTKESGYSGSTPVDGIKNDWPPHGRLSKRMSEQGNLWRKIWNDAPALPAYEQKSLLHPYREGEKILHYLETLQPYQLLEQMVCTSFRASADVLYQTNCGDLKQMIKKMDQLYLTMASILKPLRNSRNKEIVYGLRRLCIAIEHAEKLLTVAASLHDKLLQAPDLSEAIFGEYYNFYLPRMVSGSVENQMEFKTKQEVKMQERAAVTKMFTPPTANQRWRKALSMGNLLNGHEPIEREIIFSAWNSLSGNYSASCSPSVSHDVETHRMYIRGTSNDLRAALSVTSSDSM